VGYIEEQARLGLTKSFRNSSSFMREIKEDLSNNLSWYNTERYKNYISQQIDCTKLLTWAIQNAPVTEESINKTIDSMKNNE
jgi:hypothetical protein